MSGAECSRPDCHQPVHSYRMCGIHSRRYWRYLQAQGLYERVDAGPARYILQIMRARGWTWHQMGRVGQMNDDRVRRVHDGIDTTIRRKEEIPILACNPVWRLSRVSVITVGTHRRLDALSYMGYRKEDIAEAIGFNISSMWRMNNYETCTAKLAGSIAQFYDTHAYTPGPYPSVAVRARNQGKLPAAAWPDGYAIDHPDTVPIADAVRIDQPDRVGIPEKKVFMDDVELLRRFGTSFEQIAAKLGANEKTVRDRWNRYQRAQQEGAA